MLRFSVRVSKLCLPKEGLISTVWSLLSKNKSRCRWFCRVYNINRKTTCNCWCCSSCIVFGFLVLASLVALCSFIFIRTITVIAMSRSSGSTLWSWVREPYPGGSPPVQHELFKEIRELALQICRWSLNCVSQWNHPRVYSCITKSDASF